jgi:membrane-bound toxin of toxin-antitoxin system
LSAPLRLELSPSPRMAAFIIAMHGIAAACILAVVPGIAAWLLAGAMLALGAVSAWVRALLRSPASVRAIELQGAGATVELADGRRVAAPVSERRHVSRLAVSLALKAPLRRTLLISRDMLRGDSFRLLSIWALWGKLPAVARKQLNG